jgi:hypothetical protein
MASPTLPVGPPSMGPYIALAFTGLALAFALASLRNDYRSALAARRNIRRQLKQAKGHEIRWTITERKL